MITLFNDYYRKYITFSAFHQIFRRQNTKTHFRPQESAKVLLLTDIRKFLCFCAIFLMEENANNPTFQIVEYELHELHEFLNTD